MPRILTVLFFVLLLIGFLEAAFLVFLIRKKPTTQAQPQAKAFFKPTSTPTPEIADPAIHPKVIEGLRLLHQGIVVSSTATNEFRGFLTEWEWGKKIKIRLYSDDGKKTNAFLFSEDEAKRLRLVQLVDGKEKPLAFSDLKINDYVSLYITFNMTKDPKENFLSGKVVKLR